MQPSGPDSLPDLRAHFTRANESLKGGDFLGALAQSDAILLSESLTVYFDFSGVSADRQSEYRAIFYEALGMWSSVVGSQVRLVETARRSDASVVVGFRGSVQGYAAQVGGHTNWRRMVRRLDDGTYDVDFKASVAVRTVAPNGQAMNRAQLKHICAHEIGHLLGLDDSDRIGDVMGPLVLNRPASKVSASELESLRKLREAALEIRRRSVSDWVFWIDRYTL